MRRRFNPRGFRVYLDTRDIATAPILVRQVRHCFKRKVRSPGDVDDVLSNLSASTRADYKYALRRYHEFEDRA